MLRYGQRRDYFLQAVEILNSTTSFQNIQLEGRVMQNAKKSSYWSTVVCHGYARIGVAESLVGEAAIYMNLRDIDSEDKILAAIDHEANHIMPMKEGYYAAIIKKRLGQSTKRRTL